VGCLRVLVFMVLNPMQYSRAECSAAEEGAKLFERSEFLAPPQANAERGKPQAKLRAAFLLLRFLWPPKKMKVCEFLLISKYCPKAFVE